MENGSKKELLELISREKGFSPDLVRITKTKKEMVSTFTIREFVRRGWLKIYKVGKAAWVSRSEFEQAVRSHAV
jgi:hypothetical protein